MYEIASTLAVTALAETPSAPLEDMGAPIEWFYMDLDNEQQGPTDESGLLRLYDLGNIHDFTFVWNETMASWEAIRDSGILSGGANASAAGGTADAHGLRHAYV